MNKMEGLTQFTNLSHSSSLYLSLSSLSLSLPLLSISPYLFLLLNVDRRGLTCGAD